MKHSMKQLTKRSPTRAPKRRRRCHEAHPEEARDDEISKDEHGEALRDVVPLDETHHTALCDEVHLDEALRDEAHIEAWDDAHNEAHDEARTEAPNDPTTKHAAITRLKRHSLLKPPMTCTTMVRTVKSTVRWSWST